MRRSRPATASSARRRGATSPSSCCRGCRRRCATRRSGMGGTARIPATTSSTAASTCQFQLLKEKGWQPSLAVGFRDLMGTGVYSGEYLVATKTIARDFTVTGGLGWGRLASVGGVENPFCSIVRQLLHPRRRLRQGRKRRAQCALPRREHGLLRRRRVADADRQADAEGRVLLGRLHPRAAGAGGRLRAQIADQRRGRVPVARRDHARRLLHVRLHGRLQRRGLRQPVSAADAAEPRHRPGSDQPAPGERQPEQRLGERPRGARRS